MTGQIYGENKSMVKMNLRIYDTSGAENIKNIE